MAKKEFGGSLMVLILIALVVYSYVKDKELTANKKTTVGLITDIRDSNSRNIGSETIFYQFYVNGKEYKGRDGLNTVVPERVRLGKPQIGSYHVVEYDSLNINQNRIIIDRKPLDVKTLIANGTYTNGKIKKVLKGHYPYIDFFIDYQHKTDYYSFRTRLHKDSLNCGTLEECLSSNSIELLVSKKYPYLNNLYFKSRDRQNKGHYTTYR